MNWGLSVFSIAESIGNPVAAQADEESGVRALQSRTSSGVFTDAELAALRAVCLRIDQLAATARQQPGDSATKERQNELAVAALRGLDKPTRRDIESLLGKLGPLLRGFALAYLKGQSLPQLDAEDLASDTIGYVLQHNWRALRRWDPEKGALGGYLWGAMRFRVMNLRTQTRWLRLWVELGETREVGESAPPSALDGPRAAVLAELRAWLTKHGFESADLEIVCMKLLDSRSSEDVAIAVGWLEPKHEEKPDRAARKIKACNRVDMRYLRLKERIEASLLGHEPDHED